MLIRNENRVRTDGGSGYEAEWAEAVIIDRMCWLVLLFVFSSLNVPMWPCAAAVVSFKWNPGLNWPCLMAAQYQPLRVTSGRKGEKAALSSHLAKCLQLPASSRFKASAGGEMLFAARATLTISWCLVFGALFTTRPRLFARVVKVFSRWSWFHPSWIWRHPTVGMRSSQRTLVTCAALSLAGGGAEGAWRAAPPTRWLI